MEEASLEWQSKKASVDSRPSREVIRDKKECGITVKVQYPRRQRQTVMDECVPNRQSIRIREVKAEKHKEQQTHQSSWKPLTSDSYKRPNVLGKTSGGTVEFDGAVIQLGSMECHGLLTPHERISRFSHSHHTATRSHFGP